MVLISRKEKNSLKMVIKTDASRPPTLTKKLKISLKSVKLIDGSSPIWF